ncbi:MAG: hypothetical protein EXX96DRAFT_329964 [Benjaminiella poitrasii]|nr:MAG: hypothetical protein EXX96DRAFT_329964 [Benjaminiella poitrasii]
MCEQHTCLFVLLSVKLLLWRLLFFVESSFLDGMELVLTGRWWAYYIYLWCLTVVLSGTCNVFVSMVSSMHIFQKALSSAYTSVTFLFHHAGESYSCLKTNCANAQTSFFFYHWDNLLFMVRVLNTYIATLVILY